MSLFLLCSALAFAGDQKAPEAKATKAPEVKNLTPSAPHVLRPLRPTTHPMDPALSEGDIENFQDLYVNPSTIAATLRPARAKGEGKENLPIANRTTGWVDVWINSQKIGRIGPLTTARINNVAAGDYHVTFDVENTQFQYSEVTPTLVDSTALAPGNVRANVANKAGYKKPGFDTAGKSASGKLKGYELPYGLTFEMPEMSPNNAPENTPAESTGQE